MLETNSVDKETFPCGSVVSVVLYVVMLAVKEEN